MGTVHARLGDGNEAGRSIRHRTVTSDDISADILNRIVGYLADNYYVYTDPSVDSIHHRVCQHEMGHGGPLSNQMRRLNYITSQNGYAESGSPRVPDVVGHYNRLRPPHELGVQDEISL